MFPAINTSTFVSPTWAKITNTSNYPKIREPILPDLNNVGSFTRVFTPGVLRLYVHCFPISLHCVTIVSFWTKARSLVTQHAYRADPRPGAECRVARIRDFASILSCQKKTFCPRNLAHPLTMKGRVIIFSITGCPFCMRAKDKMQKLGIDYIDINLDNYPERRAEAKQRSGRNTVPQIFFNNRHIGGFDDFDKLVREDFFLGLFFQV